MKLLYYTLFVTFFCSHFQLSSQTVIKIEGEVFDNETKLSIPHVMIVNKRTNTGVFANNDGLFVVDALQSDTLILSSYGYKIKKLSYKDSAFSKNYHLIITMDKLYYTLKTVDVYPTRTLNEIERDLKKVGKNTGYTLNGLSAIESPITYLYERFSRFGKSKQKVALWENEDLKRDLLKELFRQYIRYDIIELNNAEFDAFIKYLNLSDEFVRNATQLELVLAIQGKYETYKKRWK